MRDGLVQLLDPAGVHHRDAVRQRERLGLRVGDEHERDADVALQADQLDLHLLAQLRVERAERLVEQQQARPVDESARERDPLLLAAGQFVREAARLVGELDLRRVRPGPWRGSRSRSCRPS